MKRFKFVFNLKSAWFIRPVFKDKKVIKYKLHWNGILNWKGEELSAQYNKLIADAKSLGKYLASYRDNSISIRRDIFYDQQITILEGLKARKARTAKLLKKIKILKKMEPSVKKIVDDLNNNLPLGYAIEDDIIYNDIYKEAIKQFAKRLDVLEPLVLLQL